MQWFNLDLHIHSVLSPCATWDMSPRKVIRQAKVNNLHMIAITDHHSVRNYPGFCQLGQKEEIVVIPSMEVQTKEDVHILIYFNHYSQALRFEVEIFKYSPFIIDEISAIKPQCLVNSEDLVVKIENRLLMFSVNLSLEDTIRLARKYESLIILAHINRAGFSIISQLGFIPPDIDIDGVEVYNYVCSSSLLPVGKGVIYGSDAHDLLTIGRYMTSAWIEKPTWDELKLALYNSGGRLLRRKNDFRA